MSNERWDIDRIYAFYENGQWFYFTSPDGTGKVFHDSAEKAEDETGIRSVVHLMGVPID